MCPTYRSVAAPHVTRSTTRRDVAQRLFAVALTASSVVLGGVAPACDRPASGWFARGGDPARVDAAPSAAARPGPAQVTAAPTAARRPVSLLDFAWMAKKGETPPMPAVQFDVLRIDLPLTPLDVGAGIAHSRKIWNHVDELRLDTARVALLARNGLRIGVATRADWPAMRTLFEGNDAKVIHVPQAVASGLTLSLELGGVGESETIFSFQADGALVGETFDGGTKYMHLAYSVDPRQAARSTLRLAAEIDLQAPPAGWSDVDGSFQRVPTYAGKVYDQLTVELSVGPGEFVVVGPVDAARVTSLVGSRFLTCAHDGRRYETVLCIALQPFWTGLTGESTP